MIRTASIAALALLATPAFAQEQPTATPSRGLTSVGYGADFGIFVETPLANPGPQVEFWSWMIRNEPKMLGSSEYDIVASRELVDCIAWTRKQLYSDGFLGDRHLGRDPKSVGPEPITPGVMEATAKVVCGKADTSKDAPIADIAAARALVAAKFKPQ
jgi:hypothetical protein